MVLKVSSSTIPLGHSYSREQEKVLYIRITEVYKKHSNEGKSMLGVSAAGSRTYVLEASIERLKLLPGELGLSLQLVQPLRLVPHCRQLQVTVAAVYGRKRETEEGMDRQEVRKESDVERGKDKKEKEGGWARLSMWMQVNIHGGVGSHSQQGGICIWASGEKRASLRERFRKKTRLAKYRRTRAWKRKGTFFMVENKYDFDFLWKKKVTAENLNLRKSIKVTFYSQSESQNQWHYFLSVHTH